MQSALSGRMWTAVTAANSHHQWHCGLFHPERSCIQGLAWVEFVWCATASNQFRCMTATQGTPWVCCGTFRVPYGPSTSREADLLDVRSPYPLAFPLSSLPIHSFLPLSVVVYFLSPFIFSYISFFIMILFLLIFFFSFPSFSFQIYAKSIKVFACNPSSCTRRL